VCQKRWDRDKECVTTCATCTALHGVIHVTAVVGEVCTNRRHSRQRVTAVDLCGEGGGLDETGNWFECR